MDYDTLSEAVEGLKARGFTLDFNLQHDKIFCPTLKMHYSPHEFEVVEVHRFEGDSNPDDASVLYALQTVMGDKGMLVDAYGAYADSISPELLEKLRIKH